MPTPNLQIVGGGFTTFSGAPLANGYLILTLNHDESYASSNQVVAGLKTRVTLDANGNIPVSPATKIYANDTLLPANSYFVVKGYEADGTLAYGPQLWNTTVASSPLDVGTIIPYSPPGGLNLSGLGDITLQTNGVNNSNQNLLNLAAGSNITLTNVAGTTTISATASGSSSVAHTASTSLTQTQSTVSGSSALTAYPLSYAVGFVPPSASLSAGVTALAPAIGSAITITAYSITSSIVTFTYSSTKPVTTGQTILLYNFGSSTFFNQRIVTVRGGASSSTFTASFSHGNTSATENGSGLTTTLSGSSSQNFSSWAIRSNNLYLYGGSIINVGATVLLENSAHASYLNGQQVTSLYTGSVTYGSFTHADANGYYDPGALYLSDQKQLTVHGWEIISNTLYLYSQGGGFQDGNTYTMGGFTAGSFLNGQTITANVSGLSPFFVAPFTHANDSATETINAGVVLPCSTAGMGSVAATNVFSLGILQNYIVHAQLNQATSGRTWLGCGDSRFLAGGNIGNSGLYPNSNAVSELVCDTVPYSFVGFRFSPGSAGDTHWQCVTNNAGTQTTTDSGVAGDTAAHAFKLVYTGTSVQFYIDGNLVATNTTNLPSTSLTLSPVEWVDNNDNVGNQLYCNVFDPNFTTSV